MAQRPAQEMQSSLPDSPSVVAPSDALEDFDLRNRRPKTPIRSRRAASLTNIGHRISTLLTPASRPATPSPLSRSETGPGSHGDAKTTDVGLLTQSEEEDAGRDPLPENKRDLEVRLNFHLSELDRLHNCVQTLNTIIRDHGLKYNNTRQRAMDLDIDIRMSLTSLKMTYNESIQARNGYGKFIGYHRVEVERVVRQMMKVKRWNGEEEIVPEVVAMMRTDQQWERIFEIGQKRIRPPERIDEVKEESEEGKSVAEGTENRKAEKSRVSLGLKSLRSLRSLR